MNRSRAIYPLVAAGVLGCGLLTRELRGVLPGVVPKVLGDALWAALIYLLFALIAPHASIRRIAGFAALFSIGIEVSQIYHAAWIDAIRATLPGKLILGSVFAWPDFLYYALGIGVCTAAEIVTRPKIRKNVIL